MFFTSCSAKPNFFASRYMISVSCLLSKIGFTTCSRHWIERLLPVTVPDCSNWVHAGSR